MIIKTKRCLMNPILEENLAVDLLKLQPSVDWALQSCQRLSRLCPQVLEVVSLNAELEKKMAVLAEQG